jgi:hypothetical protein
LNTWLLLVVVVVGADEAVAAVRVVFAPEQDYP